ncbi:MAG: PAS domain S-box protein, partial [Anaerolineae bacterium]
MDENAEPGPANRYGLLVGHLPLGIFAVASDGVILEANPVLLSILGISSANAARDVNLLSFPPSVEAGIAEDLQRCMESGAAVVVDRPYIGEQGKSAYLRLRLLPCTEDGCGSITVQGIVEDISDHVLTEELLREYQRRFEDASLQLAKFSYAIEQSANIVLITDLKGMIEYVNPKF